MECQSEFKTTVKYCLCEEGYASNPSICACWCDKDCEIDKYLKDCHA